MTFDECIPYPYSYSDTEASLNRSSNWTERSLRAYNKKAGYGIFAIVQGGMYKDLRKNLQRNFQVWILMDMQWEV